MTSPQWCSSILLATRPKDDSLDRGLNAPQLCSILHLDISIYTCGIISGWTRGPGTPCGYLSCPTQSLGGTTHLDNARTPSPAVQATVTTLYNSLVEVFPYVLTLMAQQSCSEWWALCRRDQSDQLAYPSFLRRDSAPHAVCQWLESLIGYCLFDLHL